MLKRAYSALSILVSVAALTGCGDDSAPSAVPSIINCACSSVACQGNTTQQGGTYQVGAGGSCTSAASQQNAQLVCCVAVTSNAIGSAVVLSSGYSPGVTSTSASIGTSTTTVGGTSTISVVSTSTLSAVSTSSAVSVSSQTQILSSTSTGTGTAVTVISAVKQAP